MVTVRSRKSNPFIFYVTAIFHFYSPDKQAITRYPSERGQIIQSKSLIFQLFVWILARQQWQQGMIVQIVHIYTAGEALVTATL